MAVSSGRRFSYGWVVSLILIAAVAVAGYFAWQKYGGQRQAPPTAASAPPAAIPATVATVRKADFPVYLTGLGVVQPYDTVTVSSRVDGQIVKIDFRQGQMVKEGDILAEIDPRPYQAALDQAEAKKTSDEANLKNAQGNLERYQTLAKEDFSTRQQLDQQQATVEQLQAQINGDQAAVDNAQTQLSYTTIRSPLSGKTGFRLVDPGNIVHATATTGIVTIVKLQPISVVFTAPEQEVPRINKALSEGTVPVDAMSSDGKTLLGTGHLALTNNAVDQASGDIQMKATFQNENNILWPGLSVSTRLLVQTIKDAIVVPSDAVQRGPDGLYAYVVGEGNKVQMAPLKVDQESNGLSLIASGLTPDQTVVTEGQSRLNVGAVVQPHAAPTPASTTADADAPPKAP